MEIEKKVSDTISGKSILEVNKQLILKTASIYSALERSFLDMEQKFVKQNIKEILRNFAEEAANDKNKINALINGEDLDIETADYEYSMFDHLEGDYDDDDVGKLITEAIKKSEELMNIFSLLSVEYKSQETKRIFETLKKHEKHRKNQLEELYDEIITRGEW